MIARRVKWREKRICILFVKIVKREKWLEKWENHEVISALLNGLIIYNNWILCYIEAFNRHTTYKLKTSNCNWKTKALSQEECHVGVM